MPNAPAKRIGEIIRILQQAHIKFETVPSLDQLATGQVKVSQLREVEIQDLLGRDPVVLDTENIRQILSEKVVMVTGAGEVSEANCVAKLPPSIHGGCFWWNNPRCRFSTSSRR